MKSRVGLAGILAPLTLVSPFAFGALLSLASLTACGSLPPPRAPVTRNHTLDSYVATAAYPGSEPIVALAAMQQFMATHREREGYDVFGRLAREQPARGAFFTSLQAAMQARLANEVPLLHRVAWVNDAIAKLDAGVAADPVLGALGRGLVFASLPDRFGKTDQAIVDLEATMAHRDELPIEVDRGVLLALAEAYARKGQPDRAKDALTRAGGADAKADPGILGNLSVSADAGFRFREARLVKEADGVYVAEGYDFANIEFIVTPAFVVAIDAGTTVASAGEAVRALRKVTTAPIKYVILTHGHWDHVGGIAALREPGTVVIAQAGFPAELARSRAYHPPISYFFGTAPNPLDVKPDRLVAAPESLTDGDVDLELIPARGGETDDALFIHDRKHDILFVGDAFMPYLGSPFVAEGSSQGYLDAIAMVRALHPRRLVHGHPPLTRLFTIDAMPGLELALEDLRARTVQAAEVAKPLGEVLDEEMLPESLRATPKAVMPYLVVRDTFIQRTYEHEAGYWRSNGEGVDAFTRADWAAALDLVGGGSDSSFLRAASELTERGDASLALQVVEMGLVRHPDSASLLAQRAQTLGDLRAQAAGTNPFRFILYSEWAGRGLPPVTP